MLERLKGRVASASSEAVAKAAERGSAAIDKAKGYKDAAASVVKEGAVTMVEKADEAQYALRAKLYNPITLEQYIAPDFDLPNMLVIADEDRRKGIDVCEGAIGWLSKSAGIEVLHLYHEAIEVSGLRFQSVPMCDKAYYRHPFDSKLFVELSGYMNVMRQEQITELKRIGYKLGAKRCRLELYEGERQQRSGSFHREIKAKEQVETHTSTAEGEKGEFLRTMSRDACILFDQSFEGDARPEAPELKWYANNSEIRSLIEMRCSDGQANKITEYHVRLSCSTADAMSVTLAGKIEAALPGLGIMGRCGIKAEAKKETSREMNFELLF